MSTLFSRQELYEMVWAKPMRQLAKQLGMSDRGLAKLCGRYEIPVPPRGYWAKVTAGRKPKIISLKKIEHDSDTKISIEPAPKKVTRLEQDNSVAVDYPEILVPADLRNPHPLISFWLSEDNRKLKEQRSEGWTFYKPQYRTDISKRRLRILSAFLKTLVQEGFKIDAKQADHGRVEIKYQSEDSAFDVCFRFKYQKTEISTDRLDTSERRRLIATEYLAFRIRDDDAHGARKEWGENEKQPLETKLGAILYGLKVAIETAKKVRAERDERHLQWELEAAERRRKQEEYFTEQKKFGAGPDKLALFGQIKPF